MTQREWPAWARPSDILDLLRLAGPVAVSRASMMLMSLTDTIVLSRNAPAELPYVLNAWLPISIGLGLSLGLLLGVSILTAEMAGRGDQKNTGRIFRRGLWISAWFGIPATILTIAVATPLFHFLDFRDVILEGIASATRILAAGLVAHMITSCVANYLEALRKPIIVTAIMYAGVVINLILDLMFVAGSFGLPKLGADGVAIATTGTRWAMAIIMLVVVAFISPAFRKSEPGEPGEGQKQIQLGYGMAASSVAEWGAFNFTFVIATWISISAGTVYGMVVQVWGFIFMMFLGIGTATSVRVAEFIGREDYVNAKNGARVGMLTCLLGGALGAAAMALLPDVIASVFLRHDVELEGEDLYPALVSLIMLTSLIVIFDGLQNVGSMAARALGSIWPPSIIHVGCYIGLMLPLAYWFGIVLGFGVMGVVAGVGAASLLAGVMQTVLVELQAAKRIKENADLSH